MFAPFHRKYSYFIDYGIHLVYELLFINKFFSKSNQSKIKRNLSIFISKLIYKKKQRHALLIHASMVLHAQIQIIAQAHIMCVVVTTVLRAQHVK